MVRCAPATPGERDGGTDASVIEGSVTPGDGASRDGVSDSSVAPGCGRTSFDWGAGGAEMFPGSDCASCHTPEGSASQHAYTVAGTVFRSIDCPEGVEGATVRVEDARGRVLELRSNRAGNVYTSEPLAMPLRVSVSRAGRTRTMRGEAPHGSCNGCHTNASEWGYAAAP